MHLYTTLWNIKNRSIIGEDTDKSKVARFFMAHGVDSHSSLSVQRSKLWALLEQDLSFYKTNAPDDGQLPTAPNHHKVTNKLQQEVHRKTLNTSK